MKFIPSKDFMLVKKIVPTTKSGIVLPDTKPSDVANDELFEVIGLASGDESGIKVGDKVVIVGYLTTFKWDGETAILAKTKDVVMTLEV